MKTTILCIVFAGLLGLVVGGVYQNMRSSIAEQREKFLVPADANTNALRRIAQRLYVGPDLENWELLETLRAYGEIVHRLGQQESVEDRAVRDAKHMRDYYRMLSIRKGLAKNTPKVLTEIGHELDSWLRTRASLSQTELESLFLYAQLLLHQGDKDLAAKRLAAIETAIPFDLLNPSESMEVETALAGFQTRLALVGNPLNIEGNTLEGKKISVAAYRGKVVYLEFWSTACGPCLKAMPKLQELHTRYQPMGFEIIGIPTDPYPGKLLDFVHERNIAWPQVWGRFNNLETMRSLGIFNIPSGILIDRQGNVLSSDIHVDYESPQRDLESWLKKVLH
ncbi:MAG: hypothetical protein Aurels2KO_48000 [Aureliella sp.]